MSETTSDAIICQQCSRSYRWKPELAGKRVKCKCGGRVTFPEDNPVELDSFDDLMAETSPVEAAIGSASSEMDLAEPEPVRPASRAGATCKGCGNAMAAGAVLCTSCGMNQQTGQKLGTAISREKAPKIPGKAAAVGMLLLKIGGAMVGTVAVVAILAMVNLQYAKYAAIAITVIGVLVHIVGTRGAIIEATDGNLGMRLLCRFVPFLALILITMRCTKDWESMKTHVLTVFVGAAIGIMGGIMWFATSVMIAAKELPIDG